MPEGNFELAKQLGIFQGLKKRGDEAVQRALFIGQQAQDEMVAKRRDAEAKRQREEEQRTERKERREIELFKEATRQKEKGEERLRQDTQRLQDTQRRERERAEDNARRAEDDARHVRERNEDIRRRAVERKEDLEAKGYEKQEKKAEKAELREEKDQAFVTKKTAEAQKLIEDEDKAVKAWMKDRATGYIAAEDATEKAKEKIRRETEKDLKEQADARKPIFEEGEEILKAKAERKKEEEKQEGELSKAKLATREPVIKRLQEEIDRALRAGDEDTVKKKDAELFKIQKESRGLEDKGAPNPRGGPMDPEGRSLGGQGGGEPPNPEGISPPRPTFGIFEGERVGTRTESIPQDMQLPREVEDFRRQKGGIGLFREAKDKKRGGAGGGAGPEAEPFRVLPEVSITNFDADFNRKQEAIQEILAEANQQQVPEKQEIPIFGIDEQETGKQKLERLRDINKRASRPGSPDIPPEEKEEYQGLLDDPDVIRAISEEQGPNAGLNEFITIASSLPGLGPAVKAGKMGLGPLFGFGSIKKELPAAVDAARAARIAAAEKGVERVIPNEGFRNLEDAAKLRQEQAIGMQGIHAPEFAGKAPQNINLERLDFSPASVESASIDTLLRMKKALEESAGPYGLPYTSREKLRHITEKISELQKAPEDRRVRDYMKEYIDGKISYAEMESLRHKNIFNDEELRALGVGTEAESAKVLRAEEARKANLPEPPLLSKEAEAIRRANLRNVKEVPPSSLEDLQQVIEGQDQGLTKALVERPEETQPLSGFKQLPEAPPSAGKVKGIQLNAGVSPTKEQWEQTKNFITKVAANNPAHPADSAAEFLARNPTLDLKDLPEEAKFVLGLDLREVESLTPGVHALINPKYTEATKAFYNDVETLHPLWKAADLTPGKGADVAVGRYFITGSPGELASLTPPQVLAATKTKERIDQLIHEIYGPNADPGSYIVKHIVRGGQGISETFPEFAMRVSTKGSGAEMGEALLNTLNRKKYLGEALKEGRKMADALPTPGQKMYAHSYLDVMSGKPGGIEKKLPPGVGKFFHEMKINFARAVLGGRTSSAIMNGVMGTLMNVAGPDFVESSMRFLTRGPKTIMGKTFEEAGLTAAKMPPFLAKRPLREVMRKVDNVLYKMFDFTTMATAGVGYQQGVLAAEKAALKHGLTGERAKKFMNDWGMKQARRVQNMGGAENASPVYADPIVSAALQFTRPMAMTANQVLVEMPAQFAKGNPWPLLKWSAGAAAIIALGDQVGENYAPRIFDFMPWNWMKGPGRTSSYGFEKALTAMYNFAAGILAGEGRSRKQRFEKSGWQAVAGNVPGGTLISDVKKNYFPSEKQEEETENLAYGQERPPLSGAEKFRRVFLGGTNEQSAERKLSNIEVDDPDVRRDEIDNAMEELEHYMRGGTKMGLLFDKLKKGKKKSTYLPPL